MGCQSDLGKDSGYVRLYWTSTNPRTGETRECENRIALITQSLSAVGVGSLSRAERLTIPLVGDVSPP